MSGFKPGDLALIVGPFVDAGRCVELVSYHHDGDVVRIPKSSNGWMMDGDPPAWLVKASDLNALDVNDNYVKSDYDLYQEIYLMPLRGDFQSESQLDREVMA